MSEHVPNPPAATVRPNERSRRLPPYRGILAVDAKDFTGYPAIQHEEMSRAVPDILEVAFRRAGLTEVWEGRTFPSSTGDGYVFGFEPTAMPYVIHPWLHVLQEVLTEWNVHSLGTLRIRLRASLHIGPLPEADDGFGGNGTPRNDTHRLLDSRPVKAVLASSSENITQVAAILSDRCYQDVVASGYTGRHLDYFLEVPATVEGKRFDQRAWLYVPAPSGTLYDSRVLGEGVKAPPTEQSEERRKKPTRRERSTAVNRIRADRGTVNTGTLHGDQTVTNVSGNARYTGQVGGDQIGQVGGDYVRGDKTGPTHGDRFGGDKVYGNKTSTVHGDQDTVHGDKDSGGGEDGDEPRAAGRGPR